MRVRKALLPFDLESLFSSRTAGTNFAQCNAEAACLSSAELSDRKHCVYYTVIYYALNRLEERATKDDYPSLQDPVFS
jgi:hypothetical protein